MLSSQVLQVLPIMNCRVAVTVDFSRVGFTSLIKGASLVCDQALSDTTIDKQKTKIFIPIHRNNVHWELALIHMDLKRIDHYDSLSTTRSRQYIQTTKVYLTTLLTWLQDTATAECNTTFNISDWSLNQSQTQPQQHNTCDCGVFTILCADHLSCESPLTYHQNDIDATRKKIGCLILRTLALQEQSIPTVSL